MEALPEQRCKVGKKLHLVSESALSSRAGAAGLAAATLRNLP